MVDATLSQAPVATTAMLIRRPVAEVFEAFVDPAITSKFWFTKGSARLATGARVRWDWEMYDAHADVTVVAVESHERIAIEWTGYGQTIVEWHFSPLSAAATFVTITETGFAGEGDAMVRHAIDSTGGFTWVLAGAKAWLEHGIQLNLVADRHPQGFDQAS